MPAILAQDIPLYYEMHGQLRGGAAQPLVLIAGLGFSTWCWFKQIPTLTQHHQVIVFDNRGCGRSGKPQQLYTVATMAADTIALLDALKIPQAHLFGTSLGGFIAQELAARYPARVARLILCCTSFGGRRSVPMAWSALQATMGRTSFNRAHAIREGLAMATSRQYQATQPRELAQIVQWREHDPLSRADYFRQVTAGMHFDGAQQAQAITAPTLILHGTDDRIVPAANARLLGQAIPRSTVRLISGAGHLVFIERATEVNQAIIDFLAAPAPVR